MKIKLLFTIAIALSFIQVFAQKTTYQRTNNTNNIIADANLKANVSFLVPHDTTTSLRGAPDSAGYLKFNPKTKTFQGYYGSVKGWLDVTSKSYVDSIANTKVKYTDTAAAFNNLVHINGNQQINGTLALHKTFYYPTADFGQAFTIFDNGIPLSDKRVLAMGKDSSGSYLRLMNDSTDFNLKGFHGGNIVTVHQDGRIKGVDPIEDLDLVTKRFLIGYATTSSLSNYVPISSANQPNGYFKLDASGNAVLRSGYMDIGPAEYFGGALEVGGTYPGAGAGGFYNYSPTGRAAYLIGGAAGHHNTDIYDYTGNNLVGFIAGTKNLTHADSLGLANVKYVDNAFQTLTTFYTDAANTGTTETDLYSYTIPANTIQANGKRVEAEYSVNILGTGGTKYLKAYFAGTALNLSATSAAASSKVNVTVIKTGTTTARALVSITFDNSATRITETDLTGLNFTASNILKITGMADAGTGGEVTAKFGKIELK